MAMGTRRAASQRHPSDPFGVRCRVKRADLDRVADSPENEAQARSSSARIPSADRSRGSGNSDSDWPPGWISQWSEWARIDVFRSSWTKGFSDGISWGRSETGKNKNSSGAL